MLGSHLVALFCKVPETLRGGTWLEEAGHRGCIISTYFLCCFWLPSAYMTRLASATHSFHQELSWSTVPPVHCSCHRGRVFNTAFSPALSSLLLLLLFPFLLFSPLLSFILFSSSSSYFSSSEIGLIIWDTDLKLPLPHMLASKVLGLQDYIIKLSPFLYCSTPSLHYQFYSLGMHLN